MLHVLLTLLYALYLHRNVVSSTECEPSKHLCSGGCPPLPKGLQLKSSESICLRDLDTEACVCWLNNPSHQLQSIFRCEGVVNGSVSQVICSPPRHCFSPDPEGPVCMIVLQCACLPFQHNEVFDHWQRAKAIVHTKVKPSTHDSEGHSVEKIHGEVREFSLKHLLFLLGFVIAPLLCWCILNFFHDGKCRKKSTEPPEAQPIPTSRCSTVDNMNNNEETCGGEQRDFHEVVVVTPSRRSTSSVRSQSVPVLLPSAPEDLETIEEMTTAQQQTLLKCESPPPYCESMERSYNADFGPPPTYEDAIRGSDLNVQQLWQTIFILQPETRENT